MIYLINVNNLMIPSLSLATLKVSIRKYRKEVVILDVKEDDRDSFMELLKDLQKNDIVGFTVYSYNIAAILRYVNYLHTSCPYITIILGGPMVSSIRYSLELIQKHPGIDYIVRGRANSSFYLLLNQIYGKKRDESCKVEIPNISYRLNGEPFAEEDEKEENEEFLRYSPWLRESEYLLSNDILDSDYGLPYSSAYGCHNGCSYCVESSQQFVIYPMERVKSELKLILSYRPKKIFFYDSIFGYNRKRSIELMKFIAQYNEGTVISVYVNLDFLTEEYYRLASKAGVEFQGVGLQTVDSKTCSTIGRPEVDTEEMRRKINSDLFQFNTDVWIGIIYGLPGGSYSEFMKTMDFALSLRSNTNIGVYRYCYYPGTELFENNISYIPKSDIEPEILSGPDFSEEEVRLANRVASFYWILREAYPFFFILLTWFDGVTRSSFIEGFSKAIWPNIQDSHKGDIDDIAFANRAEESRLKLEPILEAISLNKDYYANFMAGVVCDELKLNKSNRTIISRWFVLDNTFRDLIDRKFRLLIESNSKLEIFVKGIMNTSSENSEYTIPYFSSLLIRSYPVQFLLVGLCKMLSRKSFTKLKKSFQTIFGKDHLNPGI